MPRDTRHTQRLALAEQIARVMREQRIDDFQMAKRKLLQSSGSAGQSLPSNQEIADALKAQQAMFTIPDNDPRPAILATARRLLEWLQEFDARLSGNVAAGLINPYSRLQVHLFHDQPEAVDLFLQARNIDYRLQDKRLRFNTGYRSLPAYGFEYEKTAVTAVLFGLRQRSQKPLSPIDGKPVSRLGTAQLQDWLEAIGSAD